MLEAPVLRSSSGVASKRDGDATRVNILAALGEDLSGSKKVARADRVFVLFAGHGATRKLPSGRSQGCVIPVSAD